MAPWARKLKIQAASKNLRIRRLIAAHRRRTPAILAFFLCRRRSCDTSAPDKGGVRLGSAGNGRWSRRQAGVAELADALDLGSSDASRGGSSPSARTNWTALPERRTRHTRIG